MSRCSMDIGDCKITLYGTIILGACHNIFIKNHRMYSLVNPKVNHDLINNNVSILTY
jgi:hypothetical protein